MRKKRKQYTAEEKVRILRRHLVDRVAVSDLCDQAARTRREDPRRFPPEPRHGPSSRKWKGTEHGTVSSSARCGQFLSRPRLFASSAPPSLSHRIQSEGGEGGEGFRQGKESGIREKGDWRPETVGKVSGSGLQVSDLRFQNPEFRIWIGTRIQ